MRLSWEDESNDELVGILAPAVVFEQSAGPYTLPRPVADSPLYDELTAWRDRAIAADRARRDGRRC
jgi:hypothetical protein